jgi:hypothetical protein
MMPLAARRDTRRRRREFDHYGAFFCCRTRAAAFEYGRLLPLAGEWVGPSSTLPRAVGGWAGNGGPLPCSERQGTALRKWTQRRSAAWANQCNGRCPGPLVAADAATLSNVSVPTLGRILCGTKPEMESFKRGPTPATGIAQPNPVCARRAKA